VRDKASEMQDLMEIFKRQYDSAIIKDLLTRHNFEDTFDILLEFSDSMEIMIKNEVNEDIESSEEEEEFEEVVEQ